jgi:hypothetical protein
VNEGNKMVGSPTRHGSRWSETSVDKDTLSLYFNAYFSQMEKKLLNWKQAG